MRLLLVDDDPDQLDVRALLAEQFGHEVCQASSVEQALLLVHTQPLDYALVDLRMPDEQSGLHLIRELKRQRPTLRISVLTGSKVERFESLPERALVEQVYGKGSASVAALFRRIKAASDTH